MVKPDLPTASESSSVQQEKPPNWWPARGPLTPEEISEICNSSAGGFFDGRDFVDGRWVDRE